MIDSAVIDKKLKKAFSISSKEKYRISHPVIRKVNDTYYLSAYGFEYSNSDLEKKEIQRPLWYCLANIETGEIERITKCIDDIDFSTAEKTERYDISNVSEVKKINYDKDLAPILDDVRRKFIQNHQYLDLTSYKKYIEMLLSGIPGDFKRFYCELSIPLNNLNGMPACLKKTRNNRKKTLKEYNREKIKTDLDNQISKEEQTKNPKEVKTANTTKESKEKDKENQSVTEQIMKSDLSKDKLNSSQVIQSNETSDTSSITKKEPQKQSAFTITKEITIVHHNTHPIGTEENHNAHPIGRKEEQFHQKNEQKIDKNAAYKKTDINNSICSKTASKRDISIFKEILGEQTEQNQNLLYKEIIWNPINNLSYLSSERLMQMIRISEKINFLESQVEGKIKFSYPVICRKKDLDGRFDIWQELQYRNLMQETKEGHLMIMPRKNLYTKCTAAQDCVFPYCPYIVAAYIKYLLQNQEERFYQEIENYNKDPDKKAVILDKDKVFISEDELNRTFDWMQYGFYGIYQTETSYVITATVSKENNATPINLFSNNPILICDEISKEQALKGTDKNGRFITEDGKLFNRELGNILAVFLMQYQGIQEQIPIQLEIRKRTSENERRENK